MKMKLRPIIAALSLAAAFALATSARAQWTNYIEIEDYNYESGQFISDATDGMGGPYVGGVFSNKVGSLDVDFKIVQARGGSTTLDRVYRTNDYFNGIYLSTRNQATNAYRGYFSTTYNWKLAWQNPGEWQNYTRVFSNAVYSISTFAGSDVGVKMTLETVTSNPAQTNQTTVTNGYFDGPFTSASYGNGDSDTYWPLGLTDAIGQPLRIRLSGTNTLRLTQRLYGNTDYLKFVAIDGMTVMPPYVVSAAPSPNETLTAMKAVNVAIRRGDNPVDTNVIRLSVNGTDVTASSVITTTADGSANVYYDYDRGLPTSTSIPVELIFGDSGSPATRVTNSWGFTTPPSWPILLSTNQATLYTNQTSANVSVSIPRGLNASSTVEVDVASDNTGVAVPVGSMGGVLALVFPAGGTNVLTFAVQGVGEGTANMTVYDNSGLGLDSAMLPVNVVPTLALTMQPSQSTISCWTNSTLTLRGVASGMSPFYYTWLTNGVVVPGATSSNLSLSSLGLAVGNSYSVTLEVTNAVNAVASSPVSVTVVSAIPEAFTLYQDSFSRTGGLNGSKPDVQNPFDNQWIAGSALVTDGSSFVFPGSQAAYLPFVPQVAHVYAFSVDINGTNGSGEWMATAYAATADTGAGLTASPVFTLMRANHTGNQQSFINGLSDAQGFECFDPAGFSRLTTVLDTTTGDSSSGWTVTVWEDGVLVATHVFAANPTISYIACGGITGAGLFDNLKFTDSVSPPPGPVITQQPASVTNYSGGSATFQVAVNGESPLHYQWQRGTTDVLDATNSSLVVPDLALSGATYRVVITNAGGVAVSSNAVVTLIPNPPQAFVLYQDSFTGTGALNGHLPEVNNPGGTWSAASAVTLITNTAYAPGSGAALAFLPFTPSVGHVYVFSMDVKPFSGNTPGTEWCALGLTASGNVDADMWQDDPAAWMIQRANRSQSQEMPKGAPGCIGPGGYPGYTTWKIVLDTTTGDSGSGWTVSFVEGLPDTNVFGNLLYSWVYPVNWPINYLGFGIENGQGVSGSFDNLLLTDSVIPCGKVTLGINKSGGNLVLSWPRGILLEAPGLAGPWTTNSATSPYTNTASGSMQFFRVQDVCP